MNAGISSFYQVGGSLPAYAPSYVVRQADKDLYEALQAEEFCYVLSPRQLGKSSLRIQTMHKLQADGVVCAALDLRAMGGEQLTAEHWYAGILQKLVSSFKLKLNLRGWWYEYDFLSPVQRFSQFIEEVVLVEITQSIVIFVDEVESVLSLNFKTEDFFASIHSFYNYRAENPGYKRLTFAFLGAVACTDLIHDEDRTPFAISRKIELHAFQRSELQPLAKGLPLAVADPEAMLQTVWSWTAGQPLLTQKLCQLILTAKSPIHQGEEAKWLKNKVLSQIIQHWAAEDKPRHLRKIQDDFLRNEQYSVELLLLYQQILQRRSISAEDSIEQALLQLSGLVIKRQGKLIVANRIYEFVFDPRWITETLATLRPYGKALGNWLASASDPQYLLDKQALRNALKWSQNQSLTEQELQFLAASEQAEQAALKDSQLGFLLVLLATLIFSVHHVAITILGNESLLFGLIPLGGFIELVPGNSLLILWTRMLFLLPLFASTATSLYPSVWKDINKLVLSRNPYPLLVVVGSSLGLFLSQVMLYVAIGEIGPGVAVTILFIYPMITVPLASLLLNERITPLRITVIIAICVGIVLAAFPHMAATSNFSLLGLCTAVSAGIAFAVYLTLQEICYQVHQLNPVPVTLMQFSIVFMVCSLILMSPLSLEILVMPDKRLGFIMGGVILAILTLCGYLLNNFGFQKMEPAKGSIISASSPAITAILALLMIPGSKTFLQTGQVVGILVVTFAVIVLGLEKLLSADHEL